MTTAATRPFSNAWLLLSIAVFIVAEVVLGWFVGTFLVGSYVSPMWHLRMQVVLNLGAYLVGGVVIGLVSPGVRMVEPAVGAFISVGLVLIISWFLPYSFMRLEFGKLLLGGGVAFVLALVGAHFGERVMGNVR